MNNQKQSFFDQKTLIAIGLTTVVWIGWQMHLQKKYPNQNKPTTSTTSESTPAVGVVTPAKSASTGEIKAGEIVETSKQPEQTLDVDTEAWSFKISSQGMGVKDFTLKQYKDRKGDPIVIGGEVTGHLPFETVMLGRNAPLTFTLQKISDTHYVGRAQAAGVEITKTLVMDENKYSVETQIQVQGQSDAFVGLTNYMVEPLVPHAGSGFLNPSFERQEVFAVGAEKSERVHVAPDKDEVLTVEKMQVAALGSQYFTQAFVNLSDTLPTLKMVVNVQDKSIVNTIDYSLLNRGQQMQLKYIAFMGPKDLQLLRSVNESLIGVVDFGFFAILGRPILSMLKWFDHIVGNWGVAIILLTIMVRFLVLPFNVMSFRSMKAMQVIQPRIQELKVRYKDDPTRMNQEMLQLFRTNKVNPVGGCLPVLLQIPVFFALYQVLGHSVDLYQAPFIFWIHDLSHKDPYFVLPVLMGITMFFQMRLTPSTMDPTQAKIMMFMPLIMTVFMLTLPSGLTLYIFISTLFGIAQQLYLIKSSPTLTPVTANK